MSLDLDNEQSREWEADDQMRLSAFIVLANPHPVVVLVEESNPLDALLADWESPPKDQLG